MLGALLSDANTTAFATREGGGGMIFVCISFGRMTKMMYLCSGKWRTAPAVAKNTKREQHYAKHFRTRAAHARITYS
jgi:hypothetical protein